MKKREELMSLFLSGFGAGFFIGLIIGGYAVLLWPVLQDKKKGDLK